MPCRACDTKNSGKGFNIVFYKVAGKVRFGETGEIRSRISRARIFKYLTSNHFKWHFLIAMHAQINWRHNELMS